MPSIREFQTAVKALPNGVNLLTVQTPLTGDAARPDVGWFARVVLAVDSSNAPQARIVSVERVTSFISHTASGLRRKLKRRPVTTEKVLVQKESLNYATTTVWGFDSTAAKYPLPKLSLCGGDLLPLVLGSIETGEGRPLIDWLTEHAADLSPYLTEAGWLPATTEEFAAMQGLRGEKPGRWGIDGELLGLTDWRDEDEEDDPDLDRWR